jgi:hypothetical protein
MLQSIDAEVQRMKRANVFLSGAPVKARSTGQTLQAKDERGRAGTDSNRAESAVGEG